MIQFIRVMDYDALVEHREIMQATDVVLGVMSSKGIKEVQLENSQSAYLYGEFDQEENMHELFDFLHDKHSSSYKYIINVTFDKDNVAGGVLLNFVKNHYGSRGIKVFEMSETAQLNNELLGKLEKLYERYVVSTLI